ATACVTNRARGLPKRASHYSGFTRRASTRGRILICILLLTLPAACSPGLSASVQTCLLWWGDYYGPYRRHVCRVYRRAYRRGYDYLRYWLAARVCLWWGRL